MMTTHPLSGLAERRELLGFKAKDIAKHLQVTPDYYSKLERGDRRCYIDRAAVIAKILGCTLDQLAYPPTVEEKIAALRKQEAVKAARSLTVESLTNEPATVSDEVDGTVVDVDLAGQGDAEPLTDEAQKLADLLKDWGDDQTDI